VLITPHLTFNGNCREAFPFYSECLGGQVTLMLAYGESPLAAQTPPERHHEILHATLTFGDRTVTGADALPGEYAEPRGISLLLHIDEASRAERIFASLGVDGSIHMPLQPTFWADRFGMLTDRFGIPWMINVPLPSAPVPQSPDAG
jgi:PhnB protein